MDVENKSIEDQLPVENHHSEHLSERSVRQIFYQPTKQRQTWADKQDLPHVEWVDLFYDLFYVGMAYNLGTLVLNDMASKISILYFVCLFLPCASMWYTKLYFDGRFVHGESLYKRLLMVIDLCILASVMVHIKNVEVMRDSKSYINMFAFSLSMLLSFIINSIRMLEIFLDPTSRSEAKHSARSDFQNKILSFFFYLAAVVVSGIDYFGNDVIELNKNTDEGHRYMAESKDTYTNDIPVYLCLAAYLSYQAYMIVKVFFLYPKGGHHKKFIVPMNVGYSIHRIGEWMMLMLGESVLSLLIVDVPGGDKKYYITFFSGVLAVILMQYLHFQSEPHHAKDHAMRRDKNAGLTYNVLTQFYSLALVAIGVSYKMMLTEFTYPPPIENSDYTGTTSSSNKEGHNRMLAGGAKEPSTLEETEERHRLIANFFSISLCLALIILDFMTLAHKGINANLSRCKDENCEIPGKSRVSLTTIGIIIAKCGVIVFTCLTFFFLLEPMHLAIGGLIIMLVSVLIRTVADVQLNYKRKAVANFEC